MSSPAGQISFSDSLGNPFYRRSEVNRGSFNGKWRRCYFLKGMDFPSSKRHSYRKAERFE